MNFQTRYEICFGLIALALSGLLLALSTILRGPIRHSDLCPSLHWQLARSICVTLKAKLR